MKAKLLISARRSSFKWILMSATAIAALSSVAHAQTTTAPQTSAPAQEPTPMPVSGATSDQGSGDIVVTAQRRSERLVDIPMSVISLSTEQIEKAGVVNLHDLANVTSGVQINFAGCCTQPAIRGISTLTTGIGFENNVALYVDGFYTPDNITVNSDLANIASIEVLKGPQGTLYGRNATGGAILINTLQPSKVLTGKLAASYGSFHESTVGGYLSGPITDKIGFSVAAYSRQGDGYNRHLDAAGVVDSNRATPIQQTSIRTKLRFELSDNLTATAAYNYGLSSDARGNLFTYVQYPSASLQPSPPRASTPFLVSTNRPTTLRGAVQEGTLKLELNTGIGTFTSYSGYAHRDLNLEYDFDASWADTQFSSQEYRQDTVQQSVDLNLKGIPHTDLIIGGNYYHDNLRNVFQRSYSAGVLASNFRTRLGAESFAGYVDGTYHLSGALSISAGARYTQETKTGYYQNQTGTGAPNGLPGNNSVKYTAFTPRGSIRLEIADRTNIYASISRGFRSGGFQPSGATNPLLYTPFNPEKITAYELGFKTQQRSFRFSTAFFYYDYSNLQVGVTIPNPLLPGANISQVVNANAAEVYGIDGDLNWEPITDLNVHLGAAWLHGRYTDFHNATGTGLNIATMTNVTNQSQDWTGQQMTRAPDFSGNAGIDYTAKGVVGGSLRGSVNARYTSSFITNAASLYGPLAGAALANQQRYRQGAYALVNLSADWTDSTGQFTLGVFANNVTDHIYRLTYSGSAFGDYSSYAAPRTVGVRAGYSF